MRKPQFPHLWAFVFAFAGGYETKSIPIAIAFYAFAQLLICIYHAIKGTAE